MRRRVAMGFLALACAAHGALETERWQAEIDAAGARGGGRVVVPAGEHEVGSLLLRNGVELHLEKGAVLKGACARGLADYRVVEYPHSEGRWSAVVMGLSVTNVAITGEGLVYGQGERWPQPGGPGGLQEGTRPRGIFFCDCRDIRLEGLTLTNAACWGIVCKNCDGLLARRVVIRNHSNFNNDGFDIEAKNVLVEDCDVSSSDDALCVKSNDPSFVVENVVFRNCLVRSHCNGFKIGTASHGIVRNVRFEHSRVRAPLGFFIGRSKGLRNFGRNFYWRPGVDERRYPNGVMCAAIAIECVDGGRVTGVTVDDIDAEACLVPVFVRGGARTGRATGTPPGRFYDLSDITVSNLRAEAESSIASSVSGVRRCPARNVTLRNVDILCRGAGAEASRAAMSRPVPDLAGEYPEADMFGTILPAYGLYSEYAENLTLDNVRFSLRQGTVDARPPVFSNPDRTMAR